MATVTEYHSTYRDAIIWRQWGGNGLPWIASVDREGLLAADTLQGLRRLIREAAQ